MKSPLSFFVSKVRECYRSRTPARCELVAILLASGGFFWICSQFDIAEKLVGILELLETFELVELVPTTGFAIALLAVFSYRRFLEARREMASRREAEAEVAHLALHDALTGLPNRISIERSLDGMLDRVPDKGLGAVGVFFIDLDNFKAINDTLGHDVGDELLQAVARRLSSGLRQEEDLVGRHAGDEFIILIPTSDSAPMEYFEKVAGRLLTVLDRPFRLGAELIQVRASLGIAQAPRDGLTTTDLLKRSDVAMYSAKRQGRNRFAVYSASSEDAASVRINASDIDAALQQAPHQFYLVYQPYYSLESGEIRGVEALARWQHPRMGEVAPSFFVPLAERSGLMPALGQRILEEALQDMATLVEAFPQPFYLNINISGVELGREGFWERVSTTIAAEGVVPERIRFEVTESSFLSDNLLALRNVQRLYDAGFSLALDDFGTGYSSINHFIDVPIDCVKLDRSLVHRIDQSSQGLDVIHGLVRLFEELSMDVVAEGVETEEQRQLLIDCNCSHVQGYLYSRPMSLQRLLESEAHRRN